MTCGACSGSVTQLLELVPGVVLAAVSLLTNEAKVEHDSRVDEKMLVAAVEECGFGAEVLKSDAPKSPSPRSLTTVLDISGMSCALCSGSISESLGALPHVESADVSLVTSQGKIVHLLAVSPDELVRQIEDLGFGATVALSAENSLLLKSAFAVKGMTCGSCSASISEALLAQSGVISALVSIVTDSAVVIHTTDVSPDTLMQTIDDLGFNATLSLSVPENPAGHVTQDIGPQELRLQIYGLDDSLDIQQLQYNVEAVLNGLPGVSEFTFLFRSAVPQSTLDSNDQNDSSLLIDELSITYDPAQTGIRTVMDALNSVSENLLFFILNSIDQLLTLQLRLLSRTKEIQHWRLIFYRLLIFGLPLIALSFSSSTKLAKKLTIFRGLFVISVVELALASHILFNLGLVFFKKMAVFLKSGARRANMDVLVCISTLISYTFSVYLIVLSVWSGQTEKPPKTLFETTAMLISFVSFGKWMENKAKGATLLALLRLISLSPTTCQIVSDQDAYETLLANSEYSMQDVQLQTIAIDLLQANDIAVILPGAKIPADGVIVYGESEIDESLLTGEAMPVHKRSGDNVVGGSINGPFLIHMRVTRAGRNSQLNQIIEIVKDSQTSKAPVQRYADYIAARFVFGVLLLAAITYAFWLLMCFFRMEDRLPMAFSKESAGKYFVCLKLAISVIVVACPCALGLAAPTAVMVGTGVSAAHGALIKGGDVLEKLSGVNVILFDKTGTLTAGEMVISEARPELPEGFSEKQWWSLVGSAEAGSEHPIGKAIVRGAKERCGLHFEDDVFATRIGGFETVTGLGVKAVISEDPSGEKHSVSVGNERFVVREFPDARKALGAAREQLKNLISTVAHVVIDGQYAGFIELEDKLKPNARAVLDYLRDVRNVQVGIVTGDSKAAAELIGRKVGVTPGNVFSEVSPLEKDKVIAELRERFGGPSNCTVAFVGDGINDAPALVQADIGMAISSGTEVAIESAEVVLVGRLDSANDLSGVVSAVEVSLAALRKIKTNFFFATVYNIFMLPFAMGCFLPFNLMLPPPAAAAAMACSSVSVVVNSLFLRSWKPPKLAVSDEENFLGDDFALRTATLAEFNEAKKRFPLKRGWLGKLKRSFQPKYNPLNAD